MSEKVEIEADTLQELVDATDALIQRDLSSAGHRIEKVGWDIQKAIDARDDAQETLR